MPYPIFLQEEEPQSGLGDTVGAVANLTIQASASKCHAGKKFIAQNKTLFSTKKF